MRTRKMNFDIYFYNLNMLYFKRLALERINNKMMIGF